MYARQPSDSRNGHGIRIPGNYSGNAFRSYQAPSQDTDKEDESPPIQESDIPQNEENQAETVSAEPTTAHPVGNGRLFGKGGGIGFEELLILGLVLLVSQNDSRDDLAFLLLMLLFIQ